MQQLYRLELNDNGFEFLEVEKLSKLYRTFNSKSKLCGYYKKYFSKDFTGEVDLEVAMLYMEASKYQLESDEFSKLLKEFLNKVYTNTPQFLV